MNSAEEGVSPTGRVKVDEQDGGPASHTEDDSGGQANDVASGGVSKPEDEEDQGEQQGPAQKQHSSSGGHGDPEVDRDVHGDPDTVS